METSFEFVGDNNQLKKVLQEVVKEMNNVDRAAKNAGMSNTEFLEKLKSGAITTTMYAASIAGVSTALFGFVRQMEQVRSKMESTEASFKVFLGSSQRAKKFMDELSVAAYNNTNEFSNLAEQASKLLAYRVSESDAIPTLQRLSEVSAGANKPLEGLVDTFNKVKSMDKIDSRTLMSLKGMGLDVVQEIARMKGVSEDLIDKTALKFKDLNDALIAATDEGGRYHDMMFEKMQTLGDKIGTIKDNVTTMFNELGERFEDVLKGALDGVNFVIENYEQIGKIILQLIEIYGTYKAAVIAYTAARKAAITLEKINRAGGLAQVIIDKKQAISTQLKTLATKIYTKEVKKATAASIGLKIAAFGIVGIASALISVFGIWGAKTKDEKDEQDKLNDAIDEFLGKEKNYVKSIDKHVEALKSEKASVEELKEAYDALKGTDAMKDDNGVPYTESAFMAMSNEDRKKIAEKAENDSEQARRSALQNLVDSNYRKNWQKAKNEEQVAYANKAQYGISDAEFKASEFKVKTGLLQAYEPIQNAVIAMADLYEQSLSLLPVEEARSKVTERIAELKEQEATEQDLLNKKMLTTERLEYERYLNNIGTVGDIQKTSNELQNGIKADQQLIKDIQSGAVKVEKPLDAIKEAQSRISQSTSSLKTLLGNDFSLLSIFDYDRDTNKAYWDELIKDAQDELVKLSPSDLSGEKGNNLRDIIDNAKQQLAVYTGFSYETIESEKKARISALNEQVKIENKAIKEKRAARQADYKQQLAELDQQNKEYYKKNGKYDPNIAIQKQNLKLQFDLDIKKMDEEFENWKRKTSQDKLKIEVDIETKKLEQDLERASTPLQKQIAKANLRAYEDQTLKNNNRTEMRDELRDKLGGSEADLQSFLGGDRSGIDSKTLEELDAIVAKYDDLLKLQKEQKEYERNVEDYNADIEDYNAYVEEILAAEQWKQEQLRKLRDGEENALSSSQIDDGYNSMVQRARNNHDISNEEDELAGIAAKLQGGLTDVAFKEIKAQLDEFLASIDSQIASTAEGSEYLSLEADMKQQKAMSEDQSLTEEQRAAATAKMLEDEEAIAAIKERSAAGDGMLLKYISARKRGEDMAAQAQQNAGAQSQKDLKNQQKAYGNVIQTLDLAKNAAHDLADELGGALSSKGKKALDTLAEVADFAISSVNSIQFVSENASKLMGDTAKTAGEEITTVEKASLILTIISMAIQAIMAIVKIAKQFSKDQQLQDQIDASKEKTEELKRANDRLQRSYQSKSGVEYYKGMYKAAKDLDNVIKEQNKTIDLARQKYELLASKWGEDSDKAKEAKEQWLDLQDARDETADKEREQMEQLQSELLTTDLKSFSQSLAESMVDGFSQGKDSIEDTFDDMLDDLMRSMMTKNLALAFEGQFKDVFDKMNEKVEQGNGSLSTNDIDDIMAMMEAAKGRATTLAETYYDIMDSMGILTDEDEEASKGSITGLTQDQGDQLNARFTALQIEGANVVAATQAMQIALTQIGTDVTLQTSIMQSIQAQCTLGTQIAQNQLDELRVISAHTAAIEEHAARLKAIEQNTARL